MKTHHIATGLVLSFLMVSQVSAPVWAAKELKNLNQPLQVQTKSLLDSHISLTGHEFEGVLTEDHTYQGKVIPAGTFFKGHIQRSNHSRRFARPGYISINVEQAIFPSGKVCAFKTTQKTAKNIHDPKAETLGQFIRNGLPLSCANLGTSIPLQIVSELGSGAIAPIALGARMLAGATLEVSKRKSQRSLSNKVTYGLKRGTGVPAAMKFIGKSPNVNLQAGEALDLNLTDTAMMQLLTEGTEMADIESKLNPTTP